jgi:cytochrome P450
VINDPALIRQVLVGNHTNYCKGVGFERVKMLLGNGIIVSDGEVWRRRRTMIQPGFSRANIARLTEDVRRMTLPLRDQWQQTGPGQVLDVTTVMSHYALDIILHAIFGDGLSEIRGPDGGDPFRFLADDHVRDLQMAAQFRRLRPMILEHVRARRASPDRGADFLSALLDARDKRSGEGFSDEELLDELATLIIAGHETSAGTLNWVWYLLSQHPHVEARMLAELDALPADELLDIEHIGAMHYTQQILQEALRLYPPVWLFSRRALGADQLGGYDVAPGTHIFIAPYFLHRRSDYWPDPERFDPDRFSPERATPELMQAFIPFSSGPRRCIGEYFSLVEMRMHLAILARRFRLEPVEGQQIDIEPAVNLRTRYPLSMVLGQRSRG